MFFCYIKYDGVAAWKGGSVGVTFRRVAALAVHTPVLDTAPAPPADYRPSDGGIVRPGGTRGAPRSDAAPDRPDSRAAGSARGLQALLLAIVLGAAVLRL